MGASVCIEQTGTVENATSQRIQVRIHREASCGHCSASSMCFLGETTERIIEISDFTSDIKTGDFVGINISRSMGNKAVFLGYLVPFLILITTLMILSRVGLKDWVTGLLSLASMIPYFIILYFLRNRLQKTFTLSARKKVQ